MSRRWPLLLLGTCFTVAIVCGRNVLQSPDGLAYAVAIRDGHDLVHPHHLLYGPLVRAVLILANALVPAIDAISAAQLVNVCSALALLAAAWRLATSRHRSLLGAVLAVSVLAAVRGLAVYTARVEVYLPLLAAIAWLTVVTAGEPRRGSRVAVGRLSAATALLALASVCHQLGALWAVPVLALPWARLRERLLVVLGAGGLALGASYVAYVLSAHHERGPLFAHWLLSYALAPVSTWGAWSNLGPEGLRDLALGHVRLFAPVPETLSAVAAGIAWMALAALIAWNWRATGDRVLRRFAVVALAVHLGFVAWWMPADTDFALPDLWPLWLLGWLTVRDLSHRLEDSRRILLRWSVVLLAAIFAAVGHLGTMRSLVGQRMVELDRLRVLEGKLPVDAVVITDYAKQQFSRWYGGRRMVIEARIEQDVLRLGGDDRQLLALAVAEVVVVDRTTTLAAVAARGVHRDLVLGVMRGRDGVVEAARTVRTLDQDWDPADPWLLFGPGRIESCSEAEAVEWILDAARGLSPPPPPRPGEVVDSSE